MGTKRFLLRRGNGVWKAPVSRGGRLLHTGAERDDTRILFGGKARRENFGFVCGARRKDDADCFVYEERGAFGVQ